MDGDAKIEAKSILTKIAQDRENQKKVREIQVENEKEYMRALNGVAATPNGQIFLKQLIKCCKVFTVDEERDGVKLMEERGQRKLYLKFIRPYLDITLRRNIE